MGGKGWVGWVDLGGKGVEALLFVREKTSMLGRFWRETVSGLDGFGRGRVGGLG